MASIRCFEVRSNEQTVRRHGGPIPLTTPRRAVLVVSVVVLAFVLAMSYPAPALPMPHAGPAVLDPEMYDRVLLRLHAGGSYYDVLGEALRADGYPVRSPFNWRTPLLWTALAPLPPP